MNVQSALLYHRMFFVCLALLVIILQPLILPALKGFEIAFALLLFFGLGIPHGALDFSLGRLLFQPKLGSYWWVLFLVCYLIGMGVIVLLWFRYPLACFLFFLFISVIHFGFSDTQEKNGFLYFLEGLARGILPLTVPAYFYPQAFQNLMESSLSSDQASFVLQIVYHLFYPTVFVVVTLVIEGLLKNNKRNVWNSLELASLLLIFIILTPFSAFLIYFCFLHSLRHILSVIEEMHLKLTMTSVKWIIFQALPLTLCTMGALWLCYEFLKKGTVDTKCMINLFFVSLAALTFPHMLLVETVKFKHSKT